MIIDIHEKEEQCSLILWLFNVLCAIYSSPFKMEFRRLWPYLTLHLHLVNIDKQPGASWVVLTTHRAVCDGFSSCAKGHSRIGSCSFLDDGM